MSTPIDSSLRNAVWQALLDSSRLLRYYGDRAAYHRKRHQHLRFALLFSAAVGGVSGLSGIADTVQIPGSFVFLTPIAGVVIIAIVVWDAIADYGKKAALLHVISIECGEFELRTRHLWEAIARGEEIDADEVRAEVQSVERAMLQTTSRAGYADIDEHEGANQRAAGEAHQVIATMYGSEVPTNG